MKKLLWYMSVIASCLIAEESPPLDLFPQQHLIVHNRILAQVHQSTISVLDVMKKMELFFYQHHPQYMNSAIAKYQFFSSQWKEFLKQMIDHELMLADAEKLDIQIKDSEVREALFERFGPNIMAALDQLHLQYEEARSIIYADLVVQKMSWIRINAKALASVNNQDVKAAYVAYLHKHPPIETWEYRLLSIRSKEPKIAQVLAKAAYDLCVEYPDRLSLILEELQTTISSEEKSLCTITMSDPIETETKQLSNAYKDILVTLTPGTCSAPIRREHEGETSFRIFFLTKHIVTEPPSFRTVQSQLYNELTQQASEKESRIYLDKLRKRFGCTVENLEETFPKDFQPFSLQ